MWGSFNLFWKVPRGRSCRLKNSYSRVHPDVFGCVEQSSTNFACRLPSCITAYHCNMTGCLTGTPGNGHTGRGWKAALHGKGIQPQKEGLKGFVRGNMACYMDGATRVVLLSGSESRDLHFQTNLQPCVLFLLPHLWSGVHIVRWLTEAFKLGS